MVVLSRFDAAFRAVFFVNLFWFRCDLQLCPLLALNGPCNGTVGMSANDPKRTLRANTFRVRVHALSGVHAPVWPRLRPWRGADETTNPVLKDSLTDIAAQWTRLATLGICWTNLGQISPNRMNFPALYQTPSAKLLEPCPHHPRKATQLKLREPIGSSRVSTQ